MKNIELKLIRDKIVEAVSISAKVFIEKKRKLGQKILISENGLIKDIDPNDMK